MIGECMRLPNDVDGTGELIITRFLDIDAEEKTKIVLNYGKIN